MPPPTSIETRHGTIPFPAYVPVTTYGDKYPLDDLIRPYLPRLAPAVMVSYHYAQAIPSHPGIPLLIDSGGFAMLFEGSRLVEEGAVAILESKGEQGAICLHPREVLEFQERHADVAFTLDFPIPPATELDEARQRLAWTVKNALWALENRRRKDMVLYACVQAWDAASARECASAYRGAGFDGVAIGGLVPRASNRGLVLGIVDAVRKELPDLPIHVFGLGKPEIVRELFIAGVQSVDSSSYVKLAADGRLWSSPSNRLVGASTPERLNIAICNLAQAAASVLPVATANLVFRTFR